MKRILFTLTVLAVVLATRVQMAYPYTLRAELHRDNEAAIVYWQRVAPCGHPVILNNARPHANTVQANSWAWVTTGCAIHIIRPYWRSYVQTRPYMLCKLYVHEYGHLLGKWDINDPRNIMNHTIYVQVPACRNVNHNTKWRGNKWTPTTIGR